jgi:hypothetical protein
LIAAQRQQPQLQLQEAEFGDLSAAPQQEAMQLMEGATGVQLLEQSCLGPRTADGELDGVPRVLQRQLRRCRPHGRLLPLGQL